MKIPQIEVTVNYGDLTGKKGILIGYDRDKYYEVKFNDEPNFVAKGYAFNGIEKLKPKNRYLLQYINKPKLSHKELALDKKKFINKGKGSLSSRFRQFDIRIASFNNEYEFYNKLTIKELKSKIRYAHQNKYNFVVAVTMYYYNGFESVPLIDYDYNSNTMFTYECGGRHEKQFNKALRQLVKFMYKITQ